MSQHSYRMRDNTSADAPSGLSPKPTALPRMTGWLAGKLYGLSSALECENSKPASQAERKRKRRSAQNELIASLDSLLPDQARNKAFKGAVRAPLLLAPCSLLLTQREWVAFGFCTPSVTLALSALTTASALSLWLHLCGRARDRQESAVEVSSMSCPTPSDTSRGWTCPQRSTHLIGDLFSPPREKP